MPVAQSLVARTAADQQGVNTIVVLTYPIRFQLAPGAADGIGIAGADFVATSNGVQIASGTTDANGEVLIPIVPLFAAPVTVTILGQDYVFAFHPLAKVDTLKGAQQRLDKLGYLSGYQLALAGSKEGDDGVDGPRTQQAIMNFQTDENLVIDGVLGSKTRAQLTSRTGD